MTRADILPLDMPASRTAVPFGPGERRAVCDRVAERYVTASRFARGFVTGKLRTDPATAAILNCAAAAPFGVVADLGCGRGQLGLTLLVAGFAERVHGMDLDARKIDDAQGAAIGMPAEFSVANLAECPVPDCDTALIVDVLLQMPEGAQRVLLNRVTAAARRRILIRAFDPECGWRAKVGFAMERMGRRVRRDGVEIRPLPLPTLGNILSSAGFSVSITPCWGLTPLPNVLVVAERASA